MAIDEKKLTLTYRTLTFIGLLFLVYCFFRYYMMSNSMSSELLPKYTIGYVFGHGLALNGVIVSIGIMISQIANWMNYKIAAIFILIVSGIANLIVISL